jgi:hypothetical protein
MKTRRITKAQREEGKRHLIKELVIAALGSIYIVSVFYCAMHHD